MGYSDIYNSRALVELSGEGVGTAPEASFGTHFFQDLLESAIYPLAVYLDDEEVVFNRKFLYETPNRVLDFLPSSEDLVDVLRVIQVEDFRRGHHIQLAMDGEAGKAAAYFEEDMA